MDIIIDKVAYNAKYNARLSEKEFIEQHLRLGGPSEKELKDHYRQIKAAAKEQAAEPEAHGASAE